MTNETASRYRLPPRRERASGAERRVGFELEFSGVSLEQASAAVEALPGGRIVDSTVAERVIDTDLGRFRVELDWNFLKQQAAQNHGQEEWLGTVADVAALLVPVEVVCPPVEIGHLEQLDGLVDALRAGGATGTGESMLAAYGLHINPESPDLEASTLSAYLSAFALLQWWLSEAHQVDLTRKVSPYIDLFSESFVRPLLLEPPGTMESLMELYLQHNPSRNRALDMLPLLAEIDEERVRSRVDDPKIKARPTFHYRLANCQIEQSDWYLSDPWNIWCVLEAVAERPDWLEELGREFLARSRPLLGVNRTEWVDYLKQWLDDHELV
ncbi:amidoligase family protein [Aestuariirhabdus litorea]|uniref:Amidoligase enzyme n=1 Tax=Aestuariirhabdus litorea TaxID=2528527 RepID=A0A3P3VLU3_9GAMM|nr:amidoligase family protein [Aestuariirhabdus litorea]RRJ82848.1 hypothetical protein D0544_13440 [Aestuariirhabdus litorea]RWW93007.1 hypothetical protein DZC74_13415 [Endozoicomonadaceae bacterium GTF-13]